MSTPKIGFTPINIRVISALNQMLEIILNDIDLFPDSIEDIEEARQTLAEANNQVYIRSKP